MSNAFALAVPVDPNQRGYELGAWAASPDRAADESGPATHGFVDKIIDRLEELIEAETAALRSRTKIDLKEFNHRKSHGLLELSRAMRQREGAILDAAIRARLAGLRAKLETNRAVLKMHLEAVREISSIVSDTIRNAESDGTYSLSVRSGQKRP